MAPGLRPVYRDTAIDVFAAIDAALGQLDELVNEFGELPESSCANSDVSQAYRDLAHAAHLISEAHHILLPNPMIWGK